MSKPLVTISVFTILVISMFSASLNIREVRSSPTTWTVDDDGPADFPTIQEAIEAAGSGDTIMVMEGVYAEGQIDIVKSLTLSANGTVVVDGLRDFSVFHVEAASVTISGFHITNGSHSGILLIESFGLILKNNRVENCQGGIVIFGSFSNVIENNTLYGNHQGIELSHSTYNTVRKNKLTGHSLAILVGHAQYNLIEANIIAENDKGFWLQYSDDNSIAENEVSDNGYGIWLFPNSSRNSIYHNNFLENSKNVSVSLDSTNIWDDGYPSGGNYWSDYNGTDSYTGQHQNVTGSDGLGDTPYVFDEKNQDNYPLMKPWGVASATIDINPNTLNLKSRGRWITAHIELPDGYNANDIKTSTILLNDTILAEYTRGSKAKFNRAEVINYILNSGEITGRFMTITLTVTGELNDGTRFEGYDKIRIITHMRGIQRGKPIFPRQPHIFMRSDKLEIHPIRN